MIHSLTVQKAGQVITWTFDRGDQYRAALAAATADPSVTVLASQERDVVNDADEFTNWLNSPSNQASDTLSVRVVVGAEAAYACISDNGYSMDIRLSPGISAKASLERYACDIRRDIASLQVRARRIDEAAQKL